MTDFKPVTVKELDSARPLGDRQEFEWRLTHSYLRAVKLWAEDHRTLRDCDGDGGAACDFLEAVKDD